MFRTTVSAIIIAMLLTSTLTLAFNIQPARAEPRTIIVPDGYPTIQAAINASSPGDTIFVRSGTYTENVKVRKDHLTIESENGAEVTVVQAANSSDHVFEITANYIEISGFTVNGVARSDYPYHSGIENYYADYCNISNNYVLNNNYGIVLYHSSHNMVSNNNLSNNEFMGICLYYFSTDNTLMNNKASNNGEGIYLGHGSQKNKIMNNSLASNDVGICLSDENSRENVVVNNNISNNQDCGIFLDWTIDNIIYFNNLMNNTNTALSSGDSANIWDSPEEVTYTYNGRTRANHLGNYWSDYTGSDADGDGIGDIPYSVGSDSDNCPLMEPFENYGVTIPPENHAPNKPASLSQRKTDGITTIPEGGTTPESTVVFKGTASDPDGDDVRLEIELRQIGEPFTGEPTPETISDFVPSDTEVTMTRYGLVDAGYHWQYRAMDTKGASSDWTEFEGTGNVDFTVAVPEEWTFAVITDLHIGRGYLNYNGENYYLTDRLNDTVKWITDNSQAKKIRLVAVLGDLTEDGTPSEMSKVKDILDVLNSKGIPYFPVIGNHDIKAEGDHVFQDNFTDSFFETQCTMLGADVQWINGRVHKGTSVIQNYAFDYQNKRFIFLDWVDRNGLVADAKPYDETQTFLTDNLAASVDPVFLFSHHPMVWEPPLPCFTYTDIQTIGNIIRNSNAQVLDSFAGHIHGYYDSNFLNLKGAYWVPNQDDPLPNPNFESGNIDYKTSGTAVTPADISVLGTEALMSASIDPYRSITLGCRNVTRIVQMIQGNTFETYVDHESLALNPYIIRAETPPGKVGLHQNGVDFLVYAFTKMLDATHPVNYSLYVDGVLRDSKNSSQVERVWFRDQKVTHGTHEVNLTVVGYAPDGHQVVESIKRSFDVGRFLVALKCPADIIVTDPASRTISKQVNEIPDATYTEVDLDENGDLDKLVEILAPIDGNYVITLNGTDPGLYSMIAQFAASQEVVSFKATEIPVSFGAVHQDIINWTALSLGEEGVTVNVDSNGDSVFEYNFTSDSELSRIEYVAATTQHDLGITGITSSKSIIGESYSLPINMTTINYGVYIETFNVTFYVNTSLVASQTVTLASGNSTTTTFNWNTTGFGKGNWTLSAYAEPVLNETYVADNNVTGGTVEVTIAGDLNGNFVVNILDAILLSNAYNSQPSSPNWNSNADINGNNIVNILDAIILSNHYNQHYP